MRLPSFFCRIPCFFSVALLAGPVSGGAVETESVVHANFEDFLEGDFENVALTHSGELVLGPNAELVAGPDEPIVWAAVPAPEGDFYFGTGNQGKVYRLSADGDLDVVFEPDQVLSRALAIDEDGTLYAGTSPEGKVYRISGDGEAEVFFEPEQHYIWDIVFNDAGEMFVATGTEGNIYRLAPDHEPGDSAELFFESEQTHISTLAWDADGRLLAGTSPGGFVYRFDSDGSAFALLDTGDREVRRIVAGEDGALFVATFAGEQAGARAPARPTGNIANVISAILGAGDGENGNGEAADQAQGGGSGARVGTIYRVDAEGYAEPYWSIPGYAIHSMEVMPDGNLLVGTGNQGRIFSVSGPGEWTLLQRLETGGEVSVIHQGPENNGAVYALTSNPAQVYRMDFTRASEGHFTSAALDVEQVVRWGRFHVDGSGDGIRVATRSGNTEDPEQTWSDWSDRASAADPFTIAGPSSRYLQYRLYLESDDGAASLSDGPRVDRVRFFYRGFNVAPVVTAIKRVPAEVALQRVPSSPQTPSINLDQLFSGNGREGASNGQGRNGQIHVRERPGLATLAWQASDPNDDRLRFTLRIRSADDGSWTTLAEDLPDNFFSFNTQGFDEGRYYAKVTASDQLSNPPGMGRSGSRTSDAFLIDNTGPSIDLLEKETRGRRVTLRVAVEDSGGLVGKARYSLNGGDPSQLHPEDGIFDARRETFVIELDGSEPGAHSLLIVAEDETGNESVRPIHFEIGE